jgi:hypothetical protein
MGTFDGAASGIINRILEPVVDLLVSWMTITVSMNPQMIFEEDKNGQYQLISGSAVIIITNNGKESMKIQDVGFIFKNDRQLSISSQLLDNFKFPIKVDGKDHVCFIIKQELIKKLGREGIFNIKKVYITDSTFHVFRGGVSELTKDLIESCANGRIKVV